MAVQLSGSLDLSGSLIISGSITSTGGITISGSIASASYASNAELLDGRDSTIFATTGSNIFSGNQTICANLTTTCTITAQTLVVQTVTSSIVYSSGSNIFGNQLTDTQQFTGSMFITGSNFRASLTNTCFSGQVCSNTIATTGNATIGGTVTGTTIYGSTAICGGVVCGTCGTFTGLNVNGNVSIGSSGTNDISWGTAGGIKLSRTNIGPEYALSQRWTGTLAYIDIASSTQWNGGVTILPNGGGNVGIGTSSPTVLLSIGKIGTANQIGFYDSGTAKGFIGVSAGTSDIISTDALNDMVIRPSSAGNLLLATGPTERMRITSGGLVSINQTSSYAVFNVTGIDCGWGEGMVLNPAPNGYNGINFRLEGRTGSCVTCTWQLAKETSGSGVGELLSLNKQGLTGGRGYRADATQQWKTNGDSVFGFAVGIGTCTPSYKLQVTTDVNGDSVLARFENINGNANVGAYIAFGSSYSANATIGAKREGAENDSSLIFSPMLNEVPTERMRITSGGIIYAVNAGVDGTYCPMIGGMYSSNNNETNLISTAVSSVASQSGFRFDVSNGAGSTGRTTSMTINRSSVTIVGSLSKGSGSFRIKHPLTSKKCTHQLVHSFIEGPNADLIYSGHTKLIGGVSCINIDCVSRMTEGTFEALNRCVRIFTTNETSWSAVRGKVCGNIVVIESQDNTSEDEISWMVIGERQDEHVYETGWTDEEGRVITEPEIE